MARNPLLPRLRKSHLAPLDIGLPACADRTDRGYVQHFLASQQGATAIEYALIASLVVAVVISAISALGDKVVNVLYDKIASAF